MTVAGVLFGATAPGALADGDPASDVLASQPLFLPSDGNIPVAERDRLAGLVRSAQQAGFPIRVALITTPADLGSVTELWRKPGSYARFLGQELNFVYRGDLLVVMPNGLGLSRVGGRPAASALPASLAVIRPGRAPAAAAATAVQALAAAAGHRLTAPRAVAVSGSGSAVGSVDLGSWLALAGGAVVIILAWAASLRARPPARLRRAR
jgi:hypothetical protein